MDEKRAGSQRVDRAQAVVLLVGIYEGLLPIVSKVFGWHPFLAFPVRLAAPWWWLVSGAVLIVAPVLLEVLERTQRTPAD